MGCVTKSYSELRLGQCTHDYHKDAENGIGMVREARERKSSRFLFVWCPKSS